MLVIFSPVVPYGISRRLEEEEEEEKKEEDDVQGRRKTTTTTTNLRDVPNCRPFGGNLIMLGCFTDPFVNR